MFTKEITMADDSDFIDFMMQGGDELLNSYQCPHCNQWFHTDDAEEVEGAPDTVICPHCSKKVKID